MKWLSCTYVGPALAIKDSAGSLVNKIMVIKRKACGYRDREHFKTAIYFFCGRSASTQSAHDEGYPRKNRKSPQR